MNIEKQLYELKVKIIKDNYMDDDTKEDLVNRVYNIEKELRNNGLNN